MSASRLVHDPETHHFYLDGRQVPSVSRRLEAAGLKPDYGNVNPIVLEHARERGKHVEACAQLWSEGVLDEASVHPEALPYLDAFKRAVDVEKITDMRWQVVGYCADDDTMGITDLLCAVRGVPAIIDVKAVFKLDRTYRLQLLAYRRMHEPYRRRFILHLQKRGGYELLDCDREEEREGTNDTQAWLAVVSIARWKDAGAQGSARGMAAPSRAREGV